MTLRKACAWYHSPLAIDGLGPIPAGAEVSHGMCPVCSDLATMAHHLDVGRAWVLRLLVHLIELEGQVDQRRWGGVPVITHWLRQRCEPVEVMTKAKHSQIRRIAGSAPAYQRLMRIAHVPPPKRLRGGWTAQEVVSYVATLCAERKKEREIHA